MNPHAFPRYFVPSAVAPPAAAHAQQGATELAHCADAFRLLSDGATHEVIVGVNRAGELSYTLGHEPLSERARRELSLHELACSAAKRPALRTIQAERVFLFELEFLEEVATGQELNQPVYAYGTLLGPVGVESTPARGQLALTRADLLEGFTLASEFAFRCADDASGARAAYHALVAGGRGEEIAQGRALVLAYPLPPPELGEEDLENGPVVQLLLGELIGALRRDLERLERGRGVLAKWFGGRRSAELSATQDADLAHSLELARAALRCIPEWPSARVQALRRRLVAPSAHATPLPASVLSARAAAPLPSSARPAPVIIPSPAAAPARVQLWKKSDAEAPDWTRDFLPAQQRSAPSEIVGWRVPRSAPKAERSADWMEDFRQSEQHGAAPADEGKATKPDWMRDFDDE